MWLNLMYFMNNYEGFQGGDLLWQATLGWKTHPKVNIISEHFGLDHGQTAYQKRSILNL